MIEYGNTNFTSSVLPSEITQGIKQWGEKFYGSLLRNGDGPNNYNQYHQVVLRCDRSKLFDCLPSLGTDDGLGYQLTDYDSTTDKASMCTVTLTYSALTNYTPDSVGNEQSSVKQVSITRHPKFASDIAGSPTGSLNGAIWTIDPTTGNSGSNSQFVGFSAESKYSGYEQFAVGTISYTYTQFSTSEFSSDALLIGSVQSGTGAPSLGDNGNYLLVGSNRSKQGYFYAISDTYEGDLAGWDTTIYAPPE